ncbi:MerR family transcriptional regulator [Jinshanibacter sp. LJY008]|uniref:MerR family transcriptional regulator n=1 Tax=Limnobaculum eriocheiris TaxID=2897391 RepID=A0A9X1MZP0_9GAMM|nr:MerR family transcriptional regulator [Limnobaculum eriocheiris]MCD1127570.1 MerR family transcriptional regulator [Limnobaculum eriocheiris]
MASELTISKLAESAGVNIETIRYYQRRGLLVEPIKPPGSHRRYSADEVKRVRFIKRAQALGFTLVEKKMADLDVMRQALAGLVQQCNADDGHTICPIIDMLARE